MAHTYDVCGVGHALVDIQYQVQPEFLANNQIDKGVMTLVDADRQNQLSAAITDENLVPCRSSSTSTTSTPCCLSKNDSTCSVTPPPQPAPLPNLPPTALDSSALSPNLCWLDRREAAAYDDLYR